jgi:Holliday junction resolvase RusA-like endonuclease
MIRLPYPISANRYWRIVGGGRGGGGGPARIVVSQEAQAYKREVAAAARLHGFNPPEWPAPKGQYVEVCVQLHPRSIKAKPERKRSGGANPSEAAPRQSPSAAQGKAKAAMKASEVVLDLDNALKVTLDALTGVAWDDDSQVRRISAEYGPPCEGGGLSVWIGHIRPDDTSSVCPVSQEFAGEGERDAGGAEQ